MAKPEKFVPLCLSICLLCSVAGEGNAFLTNGESGEKVSKYMDKLHELSINPKTQKKFLAQCEQMKQR